MAIRETTRTATTTNHGSIDEKEQRALLRAFEEKKWELRPRSNGNPYDEKLEREVHLKEDVTALIDVTTGFVHVRVRDDCGHSKQLYLGHLPDLSPSSPLHLAAEHAFGLRIADAKYGPYVGDPAGRSNPEGTGRITSEAVRLAIQELDIRPEIAPSDRARIASSLLNSGDEALLTSHARLMLTEYVRKQGHAAAHKLRDPVQAMVWEASDSLSPASVGGREITYYEAMRTLKPLVCGNLSLIEQIVAIDVLAAALFDRLGHNAEVAISNYVAKRKQESGESV